MLDFCCTYKVLLMLNWSNRLHLKLLLSIEHAAYKNLRLIRISDVYVLQHFEIAGKFDHAEDGRMAHLNLETADWADLDDCFTTRGRMITSLALSFETICGSSSSITSTPAISQSEASVVRRLALASAVAATWSLVGPAGAGWTASKDSGIILF